MTTPRARAAAAAALGAGDVRPEDVQRLRALVAGDPDGRVRATALGALVRAAPVAVAQPAWLDAAADPDATVRRRAVETAPALGAAIPVAALVTLLGDDDTWVAEAAAFALGERARRNRAGSRRARSDRDGARRPARARSRRRRAGCPRRPRGAPGRARRLRGQARDPSARRPRARRVRRTRGRSRTRARAHRCGLAGPSSRRRPRPHRRRRRASHRPDQLEHHMSRFDVPGCQTEQQMFEFDSGIAVSGRPSGP